MRNTLILFSSLALAAASSAQSSYRLVDLGIVDAVTDGLRLRVNDRGQVLLNRSGRALLSAPGGALGQVGPLTGYALNALGQVAGTSGYDAYLSAPAGGALWRLGSMGERWATPHAVDLAGRVAGTATFWGYPPGSTAYVERAFLSAPNAGALRDLGTLGGSHSRAFGVNAALRVTGESTDADGRWLAFLSGPDGGPIRSLGTLPGYFESTGRGVNASGQVAGFATRWTTFQGRRIVTTRGFVSGPDGGPLVDLGEGAGAIYGLNDAGQAVGAGGTLYTPTRGVRSLKAMLDASGYRWTLNSATSISNTGFIAATATYFSGPVAQPARAVLLVPNDLSLWATPSLDGFRGNPTAVPVTVEVRRPGTTQVVSRATLFPTAAGTLELFVQPGAYDVAIKASHWLRRTLKNVTVAGPTVLPAVALVNGDVDGNNAVDKLDLARIVQAARQSGYDPLCDLDGNGAVDAADRALAVARLGSVGDD